LLDAISSEELLEWAAFYQINPFGPARGDVQAGIVASTMANIHARKGHSFKPADFLPTFGTVPARTPAMPPAEIHAALSRMFRRPS
jgi:hypothetical protein